MEHTVTGVAGGDSVNEVVVLEVQAAGWPPFLKLVELLGWPCPVRDPRPEGMQFALHITDPVVLAALERAHYMELCPGVHLFGRALCARQGRWDIVNSLRCDLVDPASEPPSVDDRCVVHWYCALSWQRFMRVRALAALAAFAA